MVNLMERITGPAPAEMRGESVIEIARMMLDYRRAEHQRLDKIYQYLRGTQPHPFSPSGAPEDVKRLAKMSRINIMKITVSAQAQTLYVDGYRQEQEGDDAPAWQVWQANQMDARQSGIHRAALAYGASYATVLPGEPTPVIRGYSPRRMTAVYAGDDDEWPLWALRAEPSGRTWSYRLYDSDAVHYLSGDELGGELTFIETRQHGIGVTPVVRFLDEIDLDEDNEGEIEPLMDIQDQIDHTTFGLKVAEHYGAFKQRAIIGFLANSEEELLKASAQRVWNFEDPDVKLHEFSETDLSGYLNSRESAIRYASVISQMPPHYLLGNLVNLSAEALVAAEAGLMRKSRERKMSFGESHEQMLSLAGRIAGFDTNEMAQVRWADTESRAFAAVVDGLLKLRDVGVPLELLLEKVPGFSQADVERAKVLIQSGDSLGNLMELLQAQMDGGGAF